MLLKGLWTTPRTLIWSEEALAFLGPHEHSPVAAGVEMSTPLGQEASEKETQLISPPLLSSLPGFSESVFSSVEMRWILASLQGMLGASWSLFPWTGLVTWKSHTNPWHYPGVLSTCLGGELSKAAWKKRCWILDLKKGSVR